MLSYLHEYHAGNHADILKHIVLIFLIEHLNSKQKPYTFFDSHAGSGLYDLSDERALKTGEAARGIQKLLLEINANSSNIPLELQSYLNIVKAYTNKNKYPGSPLIENDLLFENSVQIVSELHNTEFENLSNNLKNRNIQIYHRDGWEMLNALTPPAIKRGAILCDPSYEELDDYKKASSTLCTVFKKWSVATIALWYPLLSYRNDIIQEMKANITESIKKINHNTEILDITLCVDNENSHIETNLENSIGNGKPRLYGSGMFIINPPWKLKDKMDNIIPYLESLLSN